MGREKTRVMIGRDPLPVSNSDNSCGDVMLERGRVREGFAKCSVHGI